MSAADRIQALEQRAMRMQDAKLWLLLLTVFVAFGITFCAGDSHGRAAQRAATADSVRHVLADSSKAIEKRLAARAPMIDQAQARVDTARVRYRASAAKVQVANDTTLLIDAVPVPTLPAVAERIQSADSLVTTLTIKDSVGVAQLQDMTADRNTWRDRALLDEANASKPSRFGFKSGVAVGITVVVTIVHFLR